MPPCEMCGKEQASLRRAVVEGTAMSVCGNCVKFGVEVAGHATEVTGRSRVVERLDERARRARPRDVYDQMQEELIPDFGSVIRQARVRKGFETTEALGKKINERKTVLDHVEAGTSLPDDALVKKLERELGIKLMEKPDLVPTAGRAGEAKGFTLGDLVKRERSKKKE
ncbi:MAG TPA: multiprotein bridging factor aMBF1 [Candidatus Thermoplasmatota archaeon]|nr:multiprotein bridging factor aMBF1 [Candidatus Thermoplasmatota archaeon]